MTERARPDPEGLISLLGLRPHPREGGHFVETYRSDERVAAQALPPPDRAAWMCSGPISTPACGRR
jgi:predicted cupin superfamily sugar epimerase